jgi:hypothetical protein
MSDIRDRFNRLVRTARNKGATCDLNPPADPALLQSALALLGEGGAAYGEVWLAPTVLRSQGLTSSAAR